MIQTPSFGTMIRAARLGWGKAMKHGCFIRMADFGPDKFKVELCPLNAVPNNKSMEKTHRCWWETPAILDMIPWLQGITRIKKYIAVIISEDGSILEELTGAKL